MRRTTNTDLEQGGTSVRCVIVGTLIAFILLVMAMAASPELHERFHHDAGEHDHSCIVTLFASGAVDAPMLESFAVAVVALVCLSPAVAGSVWSEPAFSSRWVLEHAPPARG